MNNNLFSCLLTIILLLSNTVSAAELKVDGHEDQQIIVYNLIVKDVEELAGIKKVVTYPHLEANYKGGTKASDLNSFMHIVNDKKPG